MKTDAERDIEFVEKWLGVGKPATETNKKLATIKAYMPETYKSIQAKAIEIGPQAFALVREGLKGKTNHFHAMEAGYVMGTQFDMPEVTAPIALLMVTPGLSHFCVWRDPAAAPAVEPTTQP